MRTSDPRARAKTKLIATAGGSKLGNDAIKAGEIDGSVCTRPEQIGVLAAKALYEAATKKDTSKARFITYETPAITKANLKSARPSNDLRGRRN